MNTSTLLASNPIFRDFSSEEVANIQSIGKEEHFDSHVDIIREGELSDDFFVILQGKVEVLKYGDNAIGAKQFQLVTFSAGDVFGEMAFVDHLPRSSTVRTMEPTSVLRITRENMTKAEHGNEIHEKLISTIAQTSIKRLRDFNAQYVNSLQTMLNLTQKRHRFGVFFIGIFCSLSILSISEYIFHLLGYDFRSDRSTLVKIILASIPAFYFIWRFQIPWKDFGVTLNQWKISVLEGTIIGILLAIGGLAIDSLYSGVGFNVKFYEAIKHFKGGIWLIAYPILAYMQEFMARGVVQSSAQRFLNDEVGFYAVFVTAVFFATLHSYRGWQFVSLTFMVSIFMGIIYLHRRNLLGVSIVHAIVGLVYIPISEKY